MWFFGSSCIQGSLTAYWWISCWMILFCFTPPVPTIASLEINSLGAAFGASADANFPFKTPLNIRALDAGGEVITDGPDSILVRRQWGIVDWQSKHLCKRILYGCLTSCLFFFSPSLHLLLPALLYLLLSSQEVTVEANPSSACVSNDSSFQLVHGEAVFPGSICAPIQDVQLRFSVVSDGGVTLNTQWTSNFTVTGIHIHLPLLCSVHANSIIFY